MSRPVFENLCSCVAIVLPPGGPNDLLEATTDQRVGLVKTAYDSGADYSTDANCGICRGSGDRTTSKRSRAFDPTEVFIIDGRIEPRINTIPGRLYREIDARKRRHCLVMGNGISERYTVWCADWQTGERVDVLNYRLRELPNTEQPPTQEVIERVIAWVRTGNSDAAWWLGWWFEGTNHPKSIWYYVAAMRANPGNHGWVLERLYSDARSACMCEGIPSPDLGFLENIPEMQGHPIEKDWKEAVRQAENAVHVPAAEPTAAQVHKVEYFVPSLTPVDH